MGLISEGDYPRGVGGGGFKPQFTVCQLLTLFGAN